MTLYPDKDALVSYIANPYDSSSQYTNYGSYSINRTLRWTNSGYAQTQRSLIDFDFSDLPENVHIVSASLFFYGTGQHYTDITQGSSTYKSNAGYLYRILSPWNEDSVTWKYLVDSITYTTSNYASLSNSITKSQDYDVDITGLVRDMLNYPSESHGLLLKLANEIPYTKMDFRSSDYTVASDRPKLELVYYDLDTYTVGEDTTVTSTGANPYIGPFATYNLDSRHQYIYTAEELLEAGMSAGYIHSISYDVVEADIEMINFKVNIGHTNLGSFYQAGFISGLTNVVSETYYPTTGWNELVFDENTFSWDGESNLAIEICFDNRFQHDNSTVRYSTLSNDRTASKSGDDYTNGGCSYSTVENRNSGRPNIKFSALDYSVDYQAPETIESYSRSLSSANNYTRVVTTQEEGCLTSLLNETDPYKITEAISYSDGLGRTIQTQSIASNPAGKDIIQFAEFDELGRIPKSYLPYVDIKSEMGKYRDSSLIYQDDFYDGSGDLGLTLSDVESSNYPFAEIVFDDAPSSQALEQGAPGYSWKLGNTFDSNGHSNGHTMKSTWKTNTSSMPDWKIDVNGDPYSYVDSWAHYKAGEILIRIAYNENNDSTASYYNKRGMLLKSIRYNSSQELVSLYIYDELNRLRCLIPPEAYPLSTIISGKYIFSSTILDQFSYQYIYDEKGRLIEKTLPGIDPVYYIYDYRNRLVLSQDGNQRDNYNWTFVKYDEIDRPVISGIVIKNYTRTVLQDTVDLYTGDVLFEERSSSGTHGYSNTAYPDISSADVYAVNYYDDYDFVDDFSQDTLFDYHQLSSEYPSSADLRVYGKATGGKVKMIGEDKWLQSVIYYDKYGRVLSTARDLYPDGYEISNVKYKFNGQVDQATLRHTPDDSELTSITQRFEYDHRGRILEQYHQIDSQDEVLLQAFSYNELGMLVEKNIFCPDSTKFLQSVDFEFNIRGWLRTINKGIPNGGEKDLFTQELQYESSGGFSISPMYNGMISATSWWQANNDTLSAYGYQYDDLDQLKSADFYTKDDSWSDSDAYNLSNISYDKNGNIETVSRYGSSGIIDSLNYAYSGNQLQAVGDLATDDSGRGDFYDGTNGYVGTEYNYDNNGNMTDDDNKGISSISYNFLNLPETIEFSSGDKIKYTYDATGTRWKTAIEESGTVTDSTAYMGGFVYNNDTLSLVQTATGRFVPDGNAYRYDHFITDHLGSIRVVFTDLDDDGEADILQETHFYPFGMQMTDRNYLGGLDNQQLYTGKRLDEQLGLDWYAHGARYYDPQLARWHSTDPLAELYSGYSPYHYVGNNPANFVDSNGMSYGPSQDERDKINEGGHYGGFGFGSGVRRLQADPYSWNNVGRFLSDPGPGAPITVDGETYTPYQDPISGMYYYDKEHSAYSEPYYSDENVRGYSHDFYSNSGDMTPSNYQKAGVSYYSSYNERIYFDASNSGDNSFMPGLAGAATVGLYSFNNTGNYLHYLPKSNKVKVYNRPYVNQYTKNLKINSRGTALFFGINELAIANDYYKGITNFDQFMISTELNALGSLIPQFGIMLMTINVLEFLDNKIDEWSNSNSAYMLYRGTWEMTNPENYGIPSDD